MEEKKIRPKLGNLITWLILIILLYLVNFKNDLLYHSIAELFSIIVSCIVFVIVWKSKDFITNRYLLFLGTVYFFVGIYNLLHAIHFKGMGTFSILDPTPSIQFYLIARYLESTSFLIAPLFLLQKKENENNDSTILKNSLFVRKIFLIFSVITACFLYQFYI
jgi:hypothetical protein